MIPGKSASKTVKKLERPRPPKWMIENATGLSPTITSFNEVSEDVLTDLERLVKHLSNSNMDSSLSNGILKVCRGLKHYGEILESRNSVDLDRYFVVLRNAARDERIEALCRLHLLEIIELRASGWKGNENLDNYCRHKLSESDSIETNSNISLSSLPNSAHLTMSTQSTSNNNSLNPGVPVVNMQSQLSSVLAPGEVLKSSGKYSRPTKIPAKNYFKDEIIIRNSDSGKVMGIKGRRVHMIEELSGTIVSFQRVAQGAKDRLVQITGPTEESIGRAKILIDETIRRNTSPIRDRLNPLQMSESISSFRNVMRNDDIGVGRPSIMHSLSMNDASIGEYQYTVNVGRDTLRLSGCRLDVVRTAKLVLEEYFAGDAKRTLHECAEDENFLSFGDDGSSNSFLDCNTVSECDVLNLDKNVNNIADPVVWMTARNGHKLKKSSRISDRSLSHDSTPDSDDDGYKLVVEDDDDDDDSDDFMEQRAFFGKDNQPTANTPTTTTKASASSTGLSKLSLSYSRDFLLDCAVLPYSKAIPKDLPKIILEVPTILKKSSDFFDPAAYKKLSAPNSVVSNGSCWTYRTNSYGSQDADDEDPVFTS